MSLSTSQTTIDMRYFYKNPKRLTVFSYEEVSEMLLNQNAIPKQLFSVREHDNNMIEVTGALKSVLIKQHVHVLLVDEQNGELFVERVEYLAANYTEWQGQNVVECNICKKTLSLNELRNLRISDVRATCESHRKMRDVYVTDVGLAVFYPDLADPEFLAKLPEGYAEKQIEIYNKKYESETNFDS
jgi:hypothetical protein